MEKYFFFYLSKVTLREVGSTGFWKDKFIARLSIFFSKMVKMNLQRIYGNPITYENLTYGQIHNLLVDPGIQVCTDFKLQNKIWKEKVASMQEVGTFCQQYGIETIRALSAMQKRKIRKQSKPINTYKKNLTR